MAIAECDGSVAHVAFFFAITSLEQNLGQVQTKTNDKVFVTVTVAMQQSVVLERADVESTSCSGFTRRSILRLRRHVLCHVPKPTLDQAVEQKVSCLACSAKARCREYGALGGHSLRTFLGHATSGRSKLMPPTFDL